MVEGMHFGLWYASVGPFAFPDAGVALATAAERAGFESLWTGEHVAVPADYESTYPYSDTGRMAGGGAVPMAEPLVWYAYIAGQTSTIRFVTGVMVLPQREPVLVAKQVATLAVLSGERFSLGVGGGWLREEFEVLGADFPTRAKRLDEYIDAMRALWSQDKASFEGEFVRFSEAQLSPRPPSGAVPVVIGGHSEAAARRAGRAGDGFFPAKGSPEELAHLFDVVRKTAADHGRDPAEIELSVHDPSVLDPARAEATVERWRALGVDRVIVSPPAWDANELSDALERFGSEVIDRVRD